MKSIFQATLVATIIGVPSFSCADTLRSVEDITNIFTSTRSDRPTLAGSYYKRISNDEYELQRCPNGKLNCPGEEIQSQSFWKQIQKGNEYSSSFKEVNKNGKLYPSFYESGNGYQCVAFAKAAANTIKTTIEWHKGASVEAMALPFVGNDPHSGANQKHRGKIVAYFGNEEDIYPQHYPYGHVGMLAEYVYNDQGQPIGFWIVDENFRGTGNNPEGIIRKHLLKFNNGSAGAYNGSNYHFVDVK